MEIKPKLKSNLKKVIEIFSGIESVAGDTSADVSKTVVSKIGEYYADHTHSAIDNLLEKEPKKISSVEANIMNRKRRYMRILFILLLLGLVVGMGFMDKSFSQSGGLGIIMIGVYGLIKGEAILKFGLGSYSLFIGWKGRLISILFLLMGYSLWQQVLK